MEKKTHSTKFLRKRKFLLVLPLLVLPFITMIFWSLGGGKNNKVSGQEEKVAGLNTELPGANLKDDPSLSKLSFYKKANQDSIKFSELVKSDPYYRNEILQNKEVGNSYATGELQNYSAEQSLKGIEDPNEAKVYLKLKQLNEKLNQPTGAPAIEAKSRQGGQHPTSLNSEEVDRLENMMKMMKEGNRGADPEMEQLDQMLEKIMAIQHPEKEKESSKVKAHEPVQTYGVYAFNHNQPGGFYTSNYWEDSSRSNAIQAEIYGTQVLVSGSTVKMHLLQDIYVANVLIPKGAFVYGTASMENERVKITINSLRYQHSIFAIKLETYDLDGLIGLYIPGSVNNDAVRQSANDLSQSIGMSSLDPSIEARATTAGINIAKNLVSKKVKPIKVTVKGDYQVLLVGAL